MLRKIKKSIKGFSLVELIVVISIIAILSAVLIPFLLNYVESSRAAKDEKNMSEYVHSIELALSNEKVYDEMYDYAISNNYITYSDSSGTYGETEVSEEFWAPDGSGLATTITFNPSEDEGVYTYISVETAIVNDMTYGNGSITDSRVIEECDMVPAQCLLKNTKHHGMYETVRGQLGNKTKLNSKKYRHSSFTVFILWPSEDEGRSGIEVYGKWNGTFLDEWCNAAVGSGTSTYTEQDGEYVANVTKPGGTTTSDFYDSLSFVLRNEIGTDEILRDYHIENTTMQVSDGVLNKDKFITYRKAYKPTKIIFTKKGVDTSKSLTDVSVEQNKSIYVWMDDDTMYCSAKEPNTKVKAPEDISGLFGHTGSSTPTADMEPAMLINKIDVSMLDTSNTKKFTRAFHFAGYSVTDTFSVIGLSTWDMSQATTLHQMFRYAGFNAGIFSLGDLSGWNVSNVVDMSYLFCHSGSKASTYILGNLDKWNTSKTTNMGHVFCYAGGLASTLSIGDISNWDTSNVTTMTCMFDHLGQNVKNLSVGDIGKWDVSKVKNFSTMFRGAGANSTRINFGDIGKWNTQSAVNMSYMFQGCGKKAKLIEVGNIGMWNVSKVQNMSYMFDKMLNNQNATGKYDLSLWDVSSVTDHTNFIVGTHTNALFISPEFK